AIASANKPATTHERPPSRRSPSDDLRSRSRENRSYTRWPRTGAARRTMGSSIRPPNRKPRVTNRKIEVKGGSQSQHFRQSFILRGEEDYERNPYRWT